jgi:hypothetical protein
MTAGLVSMTLGYNPLEFSDLVERELKGASVSPHERAYLNSNIEAWRAELITCKRRTEMNFTSSKARSFSLYHQRQTNQLTEEMYLDRLNQERVWRCNASRFLLQVEQKLQKLKTFACTN